MYTDQDKSIVRILHLDDYKTDGDLLAAQLKRSNFPCTIQFVQTEAGYSAALTRNDLDIILSDYKMPAFDGDQAFVLARELCPGVPFILVTGELGEEFVIERLRKGVTDYVMKDNLKRLVPTIERALEEASHERQRRRAETALRESKEKYQALIETTSDFIWEMDPYGRYTYCSPQMEKLWGIDPASMIGKTPFDVMPPGERKQGEAIYSSLLSPPHPFSGLVTRACDSRGNIILIETSGVPFFDGRGTLLGFRGITRDITGRKRIEESEERLKALINHNPSLVFLKDEQGRYVYLNEAYERQFVHSKDWLGKTDFDFWPRESAEMFRADDDAVLRSGTMQQFLEDSLDLAGKRYCWLCYKFAFTDSQNHRYVGGIGIDATARVLAEEALRASEGHYRQLFETMTQGVVYHDRNGTIVSMNPAAEEILGKTREEFLGQSSVSVEHDTLREDGTPFPGLEHPAMAALQTGKPVFNVVMGVFNPRRNAYRWIQIDATPLLREREAKPYQVYAIFSDITERKQAEDRLRQQADILSVINDAVIVVDRSFRITSWNAAAERLYGWTAQEVIGKPAQEILQTALTDSERAKAVRDLQAGLSTTTEAEQRMKNGGTLLVSGYTIPLRDGTGAIAGYVAVNRDIAEKKRLQKHSMNEGGQQLLEIDDF